MDLNIKENCKALKTMLIKQYPILEENDLQCDNGNKKENMLEKIQSKIGITRDELYFIIMNL
ncbi:MAG: hypothetical protein NTU44_06880 [Bacteroidetes bacterium]|nr:hypothetical protein [Bacteroidota bacterium]